MRTSRTFQRITFDLLVVAAEAPSDAERNVVAIDDAGNP
jgi:hypothetical protein